MPTPQNGQTHSIRRQKPAKYFNLFDHFVGLGVKELMIEILNLNNVASLMPAIILKRT